MDKVLQMHTEPDSALTDHNLNPALLFPCNKNCIGPAEGILSSEKYTPLGRLGSHPSPVLSGTGELC